METALVTDVVQPLLGMDGMAHELNMDDLFGAEDVPTPPDLRLPRVLADMAGSGCCSRVAWSKYGLIASALPYSRVVNVYSLTHQKKDSRWELSRPSKIELPAHFGCHVRHLDWSSIGTDLAIVDAAGRVYVYNCNLGLAHLPLRRNAASDTIDELSMIVGFAWFPPPQFAKIVAFWKVTKEATGWAWKRDEQRSSGPMYLGTACLVITRGGRIRLLYQSGDLTWQERSHLLDDGLCGLGMHLTHASFTADQGEWLRKVPIRKLTIEGDLLHLVTYDTNSSMRLYKVEIDFRLKESKDQQRPVDPKISVRPMCQTTQCLPSIADIEHGDAISDLQTYEPTDYMLTHLQMLPAASEQPSTEQRLPTIVGVFRNINTLISSLTNGMPATSLAPQTILSSWKLVLRPPMTGNLSSGFDKLAAKKKSTDNVKSQETMSIEHQMTTPLHSGVLSLALYRYNTVLALTLSDATVLWLNATSKAPIQPDYSTAEVTSLSQSGFVFQAAEPVVAVALSPSGCLAAYQDSKGMLQLNRMENIVSSLELPVDAEHRTALATALAMAYIAGLHQFHSCLDDVIALIPPNADTELIYEFLEQVHSALGYSLDFSSDDTMKANGMLFRTPTIQRLLGAHVVLGQVKHGRSPLPAKLALEALNLRLTTFLMVLVSQALATEMEPTDILQAIHYSQWCFGYTIYIMQELDRLHEYLLTCPTYPDFTLEDLDTFMGTENSPALLVLLSSITRVLLRIICQPLRKTLAICLAKLQAKTLDPVQRAYATKLKDFFQNSPAVSAAPAPGQPGQLFIELCIVPFDAAIKEAYANARVSDADKAKMEMRMFVRAEVPEIMLPPVRKLMTEIWPRMAAVGVGGFDLGRVMAFDVSPLGFTEDRHTSMWQAKRMMDVMRRVQLDRASDKGLRFCVRCGSGMEDVLPTSTVPGWLKLAMKNCMCLGNWGQVEGRKPANGGAEVKGEA